jgi:hypothetical protein
MAIYKALVAIAEHTTQRADKTTVGPLRTGLVVYWAGKYIAQ